MSPAAPSQVPGHRLVRRIATGTYGAVWLGCTESGEYRAVKIVRRDRSTSPRHFEREFEGLRHYEPISHVHPGLVRVFQVTQSEGGEAFACVMELADDALMGRDIDPALYHPLTVRELLNHRKRLGIVDIVLLARPLLGALEELHRRGLVHRDVKPANVIFVGGRPKLADIGLVAQQSDASTCVGSLGYNAPEGSGRPAADVYSMGRMLFEMYSGIAVQSLTGPLPDLRPRLSQPRQVAFYEVILRACAPAVAARLPSAGVLLEALAPFVPQRAELPLPGAG